MMNMSECGHGICLLIFMVLAVATVTSAKDFYCLENGQEVNITGEQDGRIFTRIKSDEFYKNNENCVWNVDAGPDRRVQFTVESSELQYAPDDGLCSSYDHVTIYEEGSILTSWCGEYVHKVINSRGDNVKVTFWSDERNPNNYQVEEKYAGSVIHFTTFASKDCPPDWVPFEESCLRTSKHRQNWMQSQGVCNLEQSNLASIVSSGELEFVQNNFKAPKLWIGLNDLAQYGTFTWIDQINISNPYYSLKNVQRKEYRHCAILNTANGKIVVEDCQRSKFYALCRTEKGQPSNRFPIPQETTDKSKKTSTSARLVLLGVLVPAIIILIIVMIGLFVYNRRSRARREGTSGKRRGQEEVELNSPTTSPSAPPQYLSEPLGQGIAPPSYDEALHDPRIP